MVKEYNRHLTKKGGAIKYHLDKGESIYKISKELKVSTSTVHYYKKRPELLKCKRSSKLEKKYLEEIYKLASNKTTREMSGGLIAAKINEKLKKNNVLDKNGKPVSISKSQVNRILREKFGKPLKVKKVFYLNDDSKTKRIEFCKKIIEQNLEGKNIFFTDETRIDTSPDTTTESIRLSRLIKNRLKKGEEKAHQLIIRETKKY